MSTKKKEKKFKSPKQHIIIDDSRIGFNRIVIDNKYLNNFNYYNKNIIKLHELSKQKKLERKLRSEDRKDKSLQVLLYSTSYHNKQNNNKSFEDNLTLNNENNNIKILNTLYHMKNNDKLKLNLKKNKSKKKYKNFNELIVNKFISRNINVIKDKNINDKYDKSLDNKQYCITNFNYKGDNYDFEKNIYYDGYYKKLLGSRNENISKKNNIKNDNKTLSFDYDEKRLLCNNGENCINKTQENSLKNNKISLKKRSNIDYSKYIMNNINTFNNKINKDLKNILNINLEKDKLNNDLKNISKIYRIKKFDDTENSYDIHENKKTTEFPLIK